MGNVKYFELCASDPQVLSYCLTYWADGIVFCTCGICLTHTEETQRRNTKNFDLMSISNFVIWKRVGHGARHGKSEEQHLCFKSNNAWKRCRKHQDESGQKTLQASLTDSKEIQKIENRGKELVGRRPYEKKWTRKLQCQAPIRFVSKTFRFCQRKSVIFLSQDADRLRKDNKFSETYRQGPRVDETTGWTFWLSSSSSSAW